MHLSFQTQAPFLVGSRAHWTYLKTVVLKKVRPQRLLTVLGDEEVVNTLIPGYLILRDWV